MTPAPGPDRAQQRLADLEELTADLTDLVEHLTDDLTRHLAGRRTVTRAAIAADADPYAPIAASRH